MAYTFPVTSEAYEMVRAAIGLEVDNVIVPDSLISSPVHKLEAERFIDRSVSSATIDGGEYEDRLLYAAALYIAALIVPKLRLVTSERIEGGNLSFASVDLQTHAEKLERQAQDAISDIQIDSGESASASINTNFFVLGRRRFR